jgi:alkanesulfonate monooxygenase SsuD/methylene tetrahydromethanopterin reductase-like flavin-dependent oxidoreductase (luciferase family)
MFTMRFDMRSPSTGAPMPDLYGAALDMAEWADTRGCVSTIICEHHTSSDGYLPTPMVLASAIAARTTNLPIMIAAALLPLYDPIRLAEEMVVLDNLSKGRVSYVAAIGYRPAEYEMYGADFHRRGHIGEEKLKLLLKAKTGEPFEHDGRHVHVTPAPFTPGGPVVLWGGGSVAAARRAGRFGLGFLSQGGPAGLEEVYREAAREAGHEPGMCLVPPVDQPTVVFVADDVDRAWEELGPYLMNDVRGYAEWNIGDTTTANISFVQSAEELRAENRSHRILTVEDAVELVRSGMPLGLHPLVGGVPPDVAWPYLRTVVDEVMPALS